MECVCLVDDETIEILTGFVDELEQYLLLKNSLDLCADRPLNEHDDSEKQALYFTDHCDDEDMAIGKMPNWDCMRQLQSNVNAWCYLSYHFLPSVVGRCMWVSSIQRHCKLRSLTTPSDEAFCLLVLQNCWDVWIWECENPGVSLEYRQKNAPSVLFTAMGQGRRTEIHGGWSKDGISLYNTLVEELTTNRRKFDQETMESDSCITMSKMEHLENTFFGCARQWDHKNILHLNGSKKMKN